MAKETKKFQSSDDIALHRDTGRTKESKTPLDHLNLERRHTIFRPYDAQSSQMVDIQQKSKEYQDLDKNLKDLHTLQRAHSRLNKYYQNPDNSTDDDYDLSAKTFNTRLNRLADRLDIDTINAGIERYNAARPNEKPVPKLELPPELQLIKASADDLHSHANVDQDAHTSDHLEKADHDVEVRSKEQSKESWQSAYSWALKKFAKTATVAAYYTMAHAMSRLDVATGLPMSGYRSWNDTSINSIIKRQLVNNTALALQFAQNNPDLIVQVSESEDLVKNALAHPGKVNFITDDGSVGGTAAGIALGGMAVGGLLTYYFARRAAARTHSRSIKLQNVTGFNALAQHNPANAGVAYQGVDVNP